MDGKKNLQDYDNKIKNPESELDKHRLSNIELLESEALFRGLFDNMPSGCSIYKVINDGSKGSDYIIRNFNKMSLKIENKTLSEVVGKSLSDLRPNIDEYGLISAMRKVWETGTPGYFPVKIYIDENFSNYYENFIFRISSGDVVTIYNDVTEQKIAEEELRKSEEKFRILATNTPDHVIYNDRDLRYLWVINPQLGLTQEDMIGRTDFDFLKREDAETLTTLKKKVIETGKSEFIKVPLVSSSGGIEYFEGSFIPVKNSAGGVDGLIGYFRNVTGRISGEAALIQSDIRHRTLINTIPDLIWLKDINGVYLSCNLAFERFFGAKESEITGKTDYDFMDKETSDFFRNNDRRAAEAGVSSVNEEWLTFKGNGYYGLFETIKTPMLDAEGMITGILGIARDITDRKKTEIFLKESEQRYTQAQSLGHVGNWEYDIQNEKFWGSDEARRIYGFNKDSDKFTVDEVENCIIERERVHQALIDLIKYNKPYDIEFEIHPCEGSDSRIVKSIAEIVKDDSGRPLKIAGVVQDITRQRKDEEAKRSLEKQLMHSQKLESIGILAGGIAHDFNNILTSIIGFTELALEEAGKGSNLENYLKEVLTAGNRAKEVVSQILTFARRAGDEIVPVRVDKIAGEVLKLIRATIPSTIEIQQNIDSDSHVMGNPARIHQIFMNLCTNSFQAIGENTGTIKVGIKDVYFDQITGFKKKSLDSGKYIEIAIYDTGKGIDPEISDFIFDPYFTTKTSTTGTGLGLAVVHGIVESIGGVITVDSEPGNGTLFTIYLPVSGDTQNNDHIAYDNIPAGKGERILFVDDELSIVKMSDKILSSLGYLVTSSASSIEALKIFKDSPVSFDLVITDTTMPGLSGDILSSEIHKIRPDIPIILCTGYSSLISDEMIEKTGINYVLYKPVGKDKLAEIIRKVFDNNTSGNI